MIFVTLGSQKFQFNRLLKEIDSLNIKEEIFAQIGYSDYKPKNYKYKEFLDKEEFLEKINNADIIITHGGAGTIVNSIKKGKKVIAAPRLSGYGEHVDDHQKQIIEEFDKSGLIYGCFDINELNKAIYDIKTMKFKTYESNTTTIIEDLDKYLNM